MNSFFAISGLVLQLIGVIGFGLSQCIFWEEAIAKSVRWSLALIVPLLGIAIGWGGAGLLGWFNLSTGPVQLLYLGGWVSLLALPVGWLLCAIVCWPNVRRAVLGWVLSLVLLGVGTLGMYAALWI